MTATTLAQPSSPLDQIAAANRPVQLSILDNLITALTQGGAVTHLLVRGSLAAGTADRLSDVDLVVGVRDGRLAELMARLDDLMAVQFGVLLPGWRDTIVGPLGGAGYVYLVPHADQLLQLDLYLCPASGVEQLRGRVDARVLWHNPDPSVNAPADRAAGAEALARFADASADCGQLLVQALVLHAMLRKRIHRGQEFIAYELLYLMHTTIRDLTRASLVPHSRHHGWYHLPDEVGRTETGRNALAQLTAALGDAPLPTAEQADRVLNLALDIAVQVAPDAVADLADEIAGYRLYQQREGQAA
jgi:predicted nucleotidyltransferase